MDKHDLIQLRYIVKEIELLKKQIQNISVEPEFTTDTVKGSLTEFPYTEHPIKIHGIDIIGYDKKVERLRRQYQRKLDELTDKAAEINEYISNVPDPEVRMILQCRYINGLTWEEIEEATGINERTARRKFRKWWDNN